MKATKKNINRPALSVVKLRASCLKNGSAIALAIACKKQLKQFYSRYMLNLKALGKSAIASGLLFL